MTQLSRRRFVKGLASGGTVAALGLWRPVAWASTDSRQSAATLEGTEFDLHIGETLMDFTGSPRFAVTVNGSVPAPTLRWREGGTVTLRVANTLEKRDVRRHRRAVGAGCVHHLHAGTGPDRVCPGHAGRA